MTECVLDASALLCALQNEPGADIVGQLLREGDCIMSAVNFAEVSTKFVERGTPATQLELGLGILAVDVRPFERDQAFDVAALRLSTRHLGLSLGDRACLSLGRRLQVPVVTTERRWAGLDLGIEIRIARPSA